MRPARRTAFDPEEGAGAYAAGDPDGDTTGFVVADGQGNVLSVIQSLFNAFGSGVVPPGTGVVLQNRGRHFTRGPGASERPGAAQAALPHADGVDRDARRPAVMGFATMGGNGQAMFHVQVLTNVLDYGMDIQEAIERPRFLIGAFLPDEPADLIRLESRVPPRVFAALQRRGHGITAAPELFYRVGHAHGVTVSPDGMLRRRRRSPRRRRGAGLLMRAGWPHSSPLAMLAAGPPGGGRRVGRYSSGRQHHRERARAVRCAHARPTSRRSRTTTRRRGSTRVRRLRPD